MSRSVLMAEIPWTEYQQRLLEEDAIVMLPPSSTGRTFLSGPTRSSPPRSRAGPPSK